MPETKQHRPELDSYIHCSMCITETGGVNGQPYTQLIEAGLMVDEGITYIAIQCKRHDKPITRVKVDEQDIPKHKSCGCDCKGE